MIALQHNFCNEAQTQNRVARRAGNGHPVLVLHADFMPLSYFPLSLWSVSSTHLDVYKILFMIWSIVFALLIPFLLTILHLDYFGTAHVLTPVTP